MRCVVTAIKTKLCNQSNLQVELHVELPLISHSDLVIQDKAELIIPSSPIRPHLSSNPLGGNSLY